MQEEPAVLGDAQRGRLPSSQQRSASTAPESGRSRLGCGHRHGGQRWRTRGHSGEKEAVSALKAAVPQGGRVSRARSGPKG